MQFSLTFGFAAIAVSVLAVPGLHSGLARVGLRPYHISRRTPGADVINQNDQNCNFPSCKVIMNQGNYFDQLKQASFFNQGASQFPTVGLSPGFGGGGSQPGSPGYNNPLTMESDISVITNNFALMFIAAQNNQITLAGIGNGFTQFCSAFQVYIGRVGSFTGWNQFSGDTSQYEICITDFLKIIFQFLTFIKQKFTFQAFCAQYPTQWSNFQNSLLQFASTCGQQGIDFSHVLSSAGIGSSALNNFQLQGILSGNPNDLGGPGGFNRLGPNGAFQGGDARSLVDGTGVGGGLGIEGQQRLPATFSTDPPKAYMGKLIGTEKKDSTGLLDAGNLNRKASTLGGTEQINSLLDGLGPPK